jgi:hypothetical protein
MEVLRDALHCGVGDYGPITGTGGTSMAMQRDEERGHDLLELSRAVMSCYVQLSARLCAVSFGEL